MVRRQMNGVSFKISFTVQPIFVSQKLEQVVKSKKVQPLIINQECVVNLLSCHLSYVDYVGYTARHLHQCMFTHKNSAIGEQLLEACHVLTVYPRSHQDDISDHNKQVLFETCVRMWLLYMVNAQEDHNISSAQKWPVLSL